MLADDESAAAAQDAWDTSVSVNVEGEEVRFFHTSKSGVERIWVDRCALIRSTRRELPHVELAYILSYHETSNHIIPLPSVSRHQPHVFQEMFLAILHFVADSKAAGLCSPLFLAKVWGQTGSKLYGAKSGSDYVDNQRRFRIFNEVSSCTGKGTSATPDLNVRRWGSA